MDSYGYALIVHNNSDLAKEQTFLHCTHKPTKYAMLVRQQMKDKDALIAVKYSDSIDELQTAANNFPAWYNKINNTKSE